MCALFLCLSLHVLFIEINPRYTVCMLFNKYLFSFVYYVYFITILQKCCPLLLIQEKQDFGKNTILGMGLDFWSKLIFTYQYEVLLNGSTAVS